MIYLKQNIEKDALISSYNPNPNSFFQDKPCELINSIHQKAKLRTESTEQNSRETFAGTYNEELKNSNVSNQNKFEASRKNFEKKKSFYSHRESAVEGVEPFKNPPHPLLPKITYDNVILNPPISKQAEAILRYLNRKNRVTMLGGQAILKKWAQELELKETDCLDFVKDELKPFVAKSAHVDKLEKVKFFFILAVLMAFCIGINHSIWRRGQ